MMANDQEEEATVSSKLRVFNLCCAHCASACAQGADRPMQHAMVAPGNDGRLHHWQIGALPQADAG